MMHKRGFSSHNNSAKGQFTPLINRTLTSNHTHWNINQEKPNGVNLCSLPSKDERLLRDKVNYYCSSFLEVLIEIRYIGALSVHRVYILCVYSHTYIECILLCTRKYANR